MKAALAIAEKKHLSIPMQGGVWTRTGFVVFESATEAQLCRSVAQMNALNVSSAWALGDLGIAIQERKRAESAAKAKGLREQARGLNGAVDAATAKARLLKQADDLESVEQHRYTADLADALGVNTAYWHDCVRLARFYEVSARDETLTPKHHLVAMRGAGGSTGKLATAQQWIAQATKDALTVSELRKKVNQSLATARPPEQPAEANEFAALDAADAWAIKHRGIELSHHRAALLRVRWKALAEFMARLAAQT